MIRHIPLTALVSLLIIFGIQCNTSLTSGTNVVITKQPISQVVPVGQTAIFTVTASGNPAPTYQWQKNSINCTQTSATTSSLVISNVTIADTGSYTVVVTNSNGSVTSEAAVLSVNQGIMITTQPISQTVASGAFVFLLVGASSDPVPTYYQWYKNGVMVRRVPATSDSLIFQSIILSDSGKYQVAVGNASGDGKFSDTARLIVTQAPIIATQPIPQISLVGSAETLTVAATGWPALSYQWKKKGVNCTQTSAKSDSLIISSIVANDSGTYTVDITSTLGSITSNSAYVTVRQIPVITTQPKSDTVTVGSAVTFKVVANGIPAPTYKWKKGTADVPSATSDSLIISSAVVADGGSYTVIVTNIAGSVTSNAAVLLVQ